jgi:hypothetical protein
LAKKDKKEYDATKYKVEEVIETISERPNSHWGKFVVRARMEDKPSTIDIRHIRMNGERLVGKGISLTDSECDTVVNALVKKGYGDAEVIKEELERRASVYGLEEEEGPLRIHVNY